MNVESTEKLDLSDSLSQVFAELSKDKEQIRIIDEILVESHGISRGIIYEALINVEKILQLDELEQIAFISVLYQVTKDDKVNLKHFFSEREIKKGQKYKSESDVELTLPYTFNDYFVIQTTESDYLTAMKYKSIVDIWNNQLLEYNLNLQRKPKEKLNKKGEIIRTPKTIRQSINEMTDLMIRNKFRSNTITFCIIRDGNEEVSYDEGELTVLSGKIFIIDGFHRLSAMLNTLEKDPSYDAAMDVAIKYLTTDEAEQYLGQINKMSKFDKSFVNYLMNDKLEDKIAKEVEIKSALSGRVAKEATVSKKSLNLTSFNVLSKGIRDTFDPQNGKDRIDVADVLVNFFDYLIASYPKDFSKDLKTLIAARDTSLRNYHNSFVIFLVIASGLYKKYGKKIPSDEIVRLVDSFDFSKDGEYAKILFGEGTGKTNSNQVKKKVKDYATEKVNQLLL